MCYPHQSRKENKMYNTKRFLALLLAAALCAGGAAALAATNQKTYTITEREYELLQKYKRLEEIVSLVEDQFLFEYDDAELLDYAAQGMLAALHDDYSFYYPPAAMEEETETITGEYGGIGFEVFPNPNDLLITIRRVFYGSPAQQAGLRPGDKIIKVNGDEMSAYDLNKAVGIMRGEVGGEVTLTILRDKEMFDVTCVRAVIQTETISFEVVEDGIGYVRLHYFEGKMTQQFELMVDDFKKKGVRGLIIDLRGNPGGLVNLAVDIADVFLGDDKLVTYSEDKYGGKLRYYADSGLWDIPVVCLVDEHTASAAEILALALSEHGVSKTVGVKTYGKGIMQTVFPFYSDGAGMQLTTDYWKSPNGTNIHKEGIAPDVAVELAEDALDDNFTLVREKDNQFWKAVEVLKEMMAK